MHDGCLVVYKPKGCSSHDVIDKLRRTYKGIKCGHAGTLDPMAQGVLVVFTGKALKLLSFIPPEHLDKTYLMKVTLGVTTDSYDATGEVISRYEGPIEHSKEEILKALRNFVGTYYQMPPAYSAIKVGGKRAYALAREGKEVKLNPRKIHVTSIRMVKDYIENGHRQLLLRVHCSRGTYIRSIAHDLGEKLGCGGHLSYLLRERVGKWSFTDAFHYWEMDKQIDYGTSKSFMNFSEILSFPKLKLAEGKEERVKNGSPINLKDIATLDADGFEADKEQVVQVFSSDDKLLALYGPRKVTQNGRSFQKLFPIRVFPQ